MSNARPLIRGYTERKSCSCSSWALIIARERPRQRDTQKVKGNKSPKTWCSDPFLQTWLCTWMAVSVAEETCTWAHLAHWEHSIHCTLNKMRGFFPQVLSSGFKNGICQRERRQQPQNHQDLRKELNWTTDIILSEGKTIFQLDTESKLGENWFLDRDAL